MELSITIYGSGKRVHINGFSLPEGRGCYILDRAI